MLKEIISSPSKLVALVIVVLFGAWLLFRVVIAFGEGTERVAQSGLFVLRQILREIAAPNATPAERLNGIVIICLTLLTLFFLILILIQSVKGTVVREQLTNALLAVFLLCFFGTAITGVICTRICIRQSKDMRVADQVHGEWNPWG